MDSSNTPNMKKKRIYTEEQKAKIKIYQAEYRLKNKEKKKVLDAKWRQKNSDYIEPCKIANPNYDKEQSKKFHKANPNYSNEHSHKHDLGYWVVYLIHNFDGLNNIYCGMTQNIYNRMRQHKCIGRLNTDKYELIKQCETLEDALEFEAYMHEQGYHGKVTGRPK